MFITALALTAAAASKWLVAGKIAVAVGTAMVTAGPYIDQKIEENF